jgi:hypothetical protein
VGVRETDLVYRQNRIPRDPYSILPEHVDQVKKVVDDMINELDRLLQGRVRVENWLDKDTFHLVYPHGATLADLPSEPGGRANRSLSYPSINRVSRTRRAALFAIKEKSFAGLYGDLKPRPSSDGKGKPVLRHVRRKVG